MRLYGLIGKPLSHSFSKGYFTQKFKDEGIAGCAYESFELQSIHDLPQLLQSHPQLQGLNVTIPYKEEVLPFLHQRSDVVNAIGACNCIKIEEGKLIGFNTDVAGFKNDIKDQLQPHHQKALVLGSGGASKAIQYALQDLGITYKVVSRRAGKNSIGYDDVDAALLNEYLLLVNTTPLGMYPAVDKEPPIPYHLLTKHHFLYDVIYNPAKTSFLAKGEEQRAQICNGEQMLVLQAEESWHIWNTKS